MRKKILFGVVLIFLVGGAMTLTPHRNTGDPALKDLKAWAQALSTTKPPQQDK